jgi:hypothetical protein
MCLRFYAQDSPKSGFYKTPNGTSVGYAEFGYETYAGLGWLGVIEQGATMARMGRR